MVEEQKTRNKLAVVIKAKELYAYKVTQKVTIG
jgi:hypothetical protein